MEETLKKNWIWCQNYWNRKSKEFNLQDWKFQMNNTKTKLAQCDFTKKKISISSYFLRGKSCDEKKMRNTILHEISHVLAGYKNKHNLYWKTIAINIGCDGNVCGTMDKIPPNYILFCPKGCFKKDYYRKPNLKVCLKCNSQCKHIKL